MPTYVYACKACGHEFEKFQSFNAKALRTCPQCAEKALSKVIFPAGVVFKGSGFYVNDSKSTSTATTSKDSSPKEGSSKDTSSENGAKDSKQDSKKSTSKEKSSSSSDPKS